MFGLAFLSISCFLDLVEGASQKPVTLTGVQLVQGMGDRTWEGTGTWAGAGLRTGAAARLGSPWGGFEPWLYVGDHYRTHPGGGDQPGEVQSEQK